MSAELLAQVSRVVADVFALRLPEVGLETSPDSVERWDSIEHLNLVLALEQSFGVSFTPEEMAELTSVGAIVQAVAARRG